MKLGAGRLALAFGGTAAILWAVCSALVAMFSGSMMTMTGHMPHMDMTSFDWALTLPVFFIGLVSWSITAATAGALVGSIYNATGGSAVGPS